MRKLYPSFEGWVKEDAEHYFPELVESEDERIKDEIKDVIQAAIIPKESKRVMLAWLEKQGEKLNADDVIEWMEKHYQMTPNGGYYYLPKDCIQQFKKDFGL